MIKVQKGHCKILYEDGYENDIAEFYKFEVAGGEWEDLEGDYEDEEDAVSVDSDDDS